MPVSSAHILGMNEDVEQAIAQLSMAKELEEEAKRMKKNASETLMSFMERAKLSTLTSTITPGTVTYVSPTVTKKFNKDTAKANLMLKGVGAAVIQKCFDEATTKSARAGYVQFEAAKG